MSGSDDYLEGPYDQHAQMRKIKRGRTADGRAYTGILHRPGGVDLTPTTTTPR